MNKPAGAYVGLGSNLADPAVQVGHGLQSLGELPDTSVAAASALYRTPPWGDENQADFINAAARLETGMGALALLDHLQALEDAAGRERSPRHRWGPRILDLDLLLYDDLKQNSARLTLPHPRMHERAFVLVPLLEIAPQIVIPGQGRAADLLARLDRRGITRLRG